MIIRKKYLAVLLIIFVLISCGPDKHKFSSIVGDEDFYCGLNSAGQVKCFRYIKKIKDGNIMSAEIDLNTPFVLDQLSLPKDISNKSFEQINMHAQKKLLKGPWVRVCGSNKGQKPLCWDYELNKGALSIFDPSAVADLSKTTLFDFGSVDFIAKASPTNLTDINKDRQASLFCYVDDQDAQKFICHDYISGSRLEASVGEKITYLSVGGMVCAGTASNKIFCSALAKDPLTSNLSLTAQVEMTNGKFSSILSFAPSATGEIVGCMIADDNLVTCGLVKITSADGVFPPVLGTPVLLPLPASLASRKIKYFSHNYALDTEGSLLKIKGFGGADLSALGEDFIPSEIKSKKYTSWASGANTACGLEQVTEQINCFKVDAKNQVLTSDLLIAP